MSFFNAVKNLFFSVPDSEATFLVRGFTSERMESKIHLEEVGRKFLKGYHMGLSESSDK